jgi:hypothetical protein
MSQSPGHVVLHLYHHKNKKHEQYNALVVGSRSVEGREHPVLNLVYFDHLKISAHHALNGVDWAETLERMMDVPHEFEAEGQPYFYQDVDAEVADYIQMASATLGENRKTIEALQVELAELKLKYADTTEARDEALQGLADAHRINIETKHYADGSSATGPEPLPDQSPSGAPAVAVGEQAQEATSSGAN